MFVAAPGNVFVACDEAQLELRMVAGLSGCAYYLERFADPKIDPHHDLCVDTFGEAYLQATKEGKKLLRTCVKKLTYGGLYGASDEVKLGIITSAEDSETEKLLFPNFALREVQAFSNSWHKRCPEIAKWWEATLAEWQKQGFLTEPIKGLRCDFLDGEDPNKLYNYKAQSGGAALCHLALFRAMERLPREAPSARLVQQGHDSIVFECRENEGQTVARILEESMAEDGNKYGLPISFVGESKVGKSWKEV
jgi:DNA polymerase-1